MMLMIMMKEEKKEEERKNEKMSDYDDVDNEIGDGEKDKQNES